MNKRLTATEYIFSIVIIFLLVCIAGAFFLGFKIGTDKADVRYAAILEKYEEQNREPAAYEQQVLVSFYHTIFTPYREYQIQWFNRLYVLDRSTTADPASLLRELAKIADESYAVVQNVEIPENSPLLREAQQNYMKSLKLFGDATRRFQDQAGSLPVSALLAEIEKDAFFQEAKNFALTAQAQYYQAIVEWNKSVAPGLAGADAIARSDLPLKEWNLLGINVKNAFIASHLMNRKLYVSYYPQDITLRVDELISSGQAGRMNLTEAGKIAEMLVSTGAVRPGDFIAGKDRRYGGEALPQLPFFLEQQ